MNIKIEKLIKDLGYCCLWSWLETNRRQYTSTLMEVLPGVSARALRYHRARHRVGATACENCTVCLKQRIKDGHTIQLHPRKDSDTASK